MPDHHPHAAPSQPDPIAEALVAPTAEVATIETVADWWPIHRALAARHRSPIALSIAGGLAADRAAWAFASGHQAALRALLPTLGDDLVVSFCVTEANGNRPRDILTTFSPTGEDRISITGAKRWATLAPASTLLLVAGATPAGAGERASLKLARVPAQAAGVSIETMPSTGFVPELPHARITLDAVQVPVSALLPGDGYDRYVKPFRTLEDIYINAALVAWLLREARSRGWPTGFAERLAATLGALERASQADPSAPAGHVMLAGVLAWTTQLCQEAGSLWAVDKDPAAVRWQRDAGLFGVASSARQQRAARAWERLARAVSPPPAA